MSNELKQIKKLYGEDMAHLCRELFPTLLETEGLLLKLLNAKFYPSRFLYKDIINQGKKQEFKRTIYKSAELKNNIKIVTDKSPVELMSEAGYILYECKSEEEIQSFKKYYSLNEELCTFYGGRLIDNYVFFAVRKDVDSIKREDFINPERQDLYGTSVISIQFSRGDGNVLSIKNRYNHHVDNPDATFGNNLENIISGLTSSFEKEYDLEIISNEEGFELKGYVLAKDKRYYKYNYEINNVYYCPDNIIIDNFKVNRLDPSRYILIDYFILDLKEKSIETYNNHEIITDAFVDSLAGMDKISVINAEYGKEISIAFADKTKETVVIRIDKKNNIIGLYHPNILTGNSNFLKHNKELIELDAPNLEVTESGFLKRNRELMKLNLPSAITIGDGLLCDNNKLTELSLPSASTIGNELIYYNKVLVKVNLPSAVIIGDDFLPSNEALKKINLPLAKSIGHNFLYNNKILIEIDLPQAMIIGDNFLYNNLALTKLDLQSAIKIGENFLMCNRELAELHLPSATIIKNKFLYCNKSLTEIDLPSAVEIGYGFLLINEVIKKIYLPSVKIIGDDFLHLNKTAEILYASQLIKIGKTRFDYNKIIRKEPMNSTEEKKEIILLLK